VHRDKDTSDYLRKEKQKRNLISRHFPRAHL